MSEGVPPEARIRPHRKLSLVWLIPLVALVGGGWVVYVNASKSGPEIQVTFRTAEGLERLIRVVRVDGTPAISTADWVVRRSATTRAREPKRNSISRG